MPPRPFYCWKLFWFGLIILVGLGVISLQSMEASALWRFDLGKHTCLLLRSDASTIFLQGPKLGGPATESFRVDQGRVRAGDLKMMSKLGWKVYPLRDEYVLHPLFYGWLVLLFWRAKRRNRPAEASPPSVDRA